jgi:CheY-like chemotaxis protein
VVALHRVVERPTDEKLSCGGAENTLFWSKIGVEDGEIGKPTYRTWGEGPMRRILVVDDLDMNRRTLENILRNAGYDTVGASNGAEALARLREKRPDLVISDIHMPNIDGFELCRLIKGAENTQDVPVILITAREPGGWEKMGSLSRGPDAYTTYPVKERELLDMVRKLLGDTD